MNGKCKNFESNSALFDFQHNALSTGGLFQYFQHLLDTLYNFFHDLNHHYIIWKTWNKNLSILEIFHENLNDFFKTISSVFALSQTILTKIQQILCFLNISPNFIPFLRTKRSKISLQNFSQGIFEINYERIAQSYVTKLRIRRQHHPCPLFTTKRPFNLF